MQVRRCFIQVHNTIKQIQIGITFLKCFCILLQYFNGCFCLLCKISICTHHRSVILFAYLNDILVECLFFITRILYFFQIIFLSTILTLLSCIILHKCLPKAFLIRLFQRFLYINSVPSCPFGYHIITDKLSVIMCQMSLSHWKRNCFCSQSFYLLSSSNALNAVLLGTFSNINSSRSIASSAGSFVTFVKSNSLLVLTQASKHKSLSEGSARLLPALWLTYLP